MTALCRDAYVGPCGSTCECFPDERYEDGDYSTGTVEDYEGDWLSEESECPFSYEFPAERAARVAQRADEVRHLVALTPGMVQTLRRAQANVGRVVHRRG